MENGQYRRHEHHLVLLFDELDRLPELFDLPVKSIDFDVKGNKTLKKNSIEPAKGVTVRTHSFVAVNMKGLVAHNALDVQRLISDLAKHGAITCYFTRLLVEWHDGRIDQWKRRTIPSLAQYVSRSSGIQRTNVLTIVRPTPEELVPLGERYADLASPTNCPIEYVEGKEVRTCAGLQRMW
jgi:hypothetical protein